MIWPILAVLLVGVPVVVTPTLAVNDVVNDTHSFQVLCKLADGKYDDKMLGTCEGGQWLNVYKKVID